MKQFLLLFLICTSFVQINAQIISGTKLTENIVAKDINGKDVDIFADLAAGKSVIIDVFATWCSPCWSYHNSGVLKELNKVLGPNGTDQIRVYAIEGDERTPLNLIYEAASGGAASNTSLGDWTEGVEYSIINSSAFNNTLKIVAFPTLYVIRPDKTVLDNFSQRFNLDAWVKALVPTAEKDIIFTTALPDRTFCNTSIFSTRPKFMNMGTTPISSIDATLSINGEETLVSVNKAVGVFETADISFGNKTVSSTTEFVVTIDGIDGVEDEDDNLSTIKGTFYKPIVEEKTITVKFTTDFYPSETSWRLLDNKNRVIHTQPAYRAGNEDQFGGGGPDANKEFTYDIAIANVDINCLTLTITDSYGDGMTTFGNQHPIPGVELYTSTGDLLKPKMESDYNFQSAAANTPSTTRIFAAASLSSSLEDASFVENLNIYPNPVHDILNIEMSIKSNTEYEVFVTDIMGASVTDVNKNTNYLNVSNLSSGMYFLNVRTKDGVYTHKFTKI